jgi:hypothetical protein
MGRRWSSGAGNHANVRKRSVVETELFMTADASLQGIQHQLAQPRLLEGITADVNLGITADINKGGAGGGGGGGAGAAGAAGAGSAGGAGGERSAAGSVSRKVYPEDPSLVLSEDPSLVLSEVASEVDEGGTGA